MQEQVGSFGEAQGDAASQQRPFVAAPEEVLVMVFSGDNVLDTRGAAAFDTWVRSPRRHRTATQRNASASAQREPIPRSRSRGGARMSCA
eukprot:scaffold3144_cov188-Prasinococcus_capsulatus_cf.AAC.1